MTVGKNRFGATGRQILFAHKEDGVECQSKMRFHSAAALVDNAGDIRVSKDNGKTWGKAWHAVPILCPGTGVARPSGAKGDEPPVR
jgi:hypothetical protein